MSEQNSLLLIPVYDLQALFNSWKFYLHGIEAILRNSGDDTSVEKIYNDLMAGRLLLWVAFVNGEYIGFVTTQVLDIPGTEKTLWIVHAYKRLKVNSEWLLESFKELENFARKFQCTRIKFYGMEKPWQEKMINLGFTKGYVEFVKEVSKDENLQKNNS